MSMKAQSGTAVSGGISTGNLCENLQKKLGGRFFTEEYLVEKSDEQLTCHELQLKAINFSRNIIGDKCAPTSRTVSIGSLHMR